jgi:hypothetical protein
LFLLAQHLGFDSTSTRPQGEVVTDPKVQQQLISLKSNAQLTVVLQWPANLDRGAFTNVSLASERLALLDRHFVDLKAPVLNGLAKLSDVEVKDLPSCGNAIITTCVSRLQELVDPEGILGRHREIEVLPNDQYHGLANAL